MNPNNRQPRLRLRVSGAAESSLRAGHPWVFAESVREQNRAGQVGELAAVFDRKDRFLAVGLFDPDSPLRFRVLHAGQPQAINGDWWSGRLEQALARRRGRLGEQTSGYRCINGESEGWPGLVLDRYDQTLALKIYTAAWLPRLEEMVELIAGHFHPQRIVLRLSRNIQSIVNENFHRADGAILRGPPLEGPVAFLETGLQFEADVLRGQKTGFFLDQRENRRLVETLARDRAVLNAFGFSGAFSVYAARGGARSTTDVDISGHALWAAKRHFALNACTSCGPHELVQADAFVWLAEASRRFDLIVLDPPSLAKREAEKAGARRAYGRLATSAIKHLTPGGILAACSCSAHVTAEEFFDIVRHSAAQSGRKFQELRATGHAPDHPAAFKEAQYLKAIFLRLD